MSEADQQTEGQPRSGQPKAGDRRRARRLALQALYHRHYSKSPINDIEAQFIVDNDMTKVDIVYFQDLLRGVHREQSELDKVIEPYLDRALKEVDPIELAIVRIGAFELKNRIDVPYKVVITEGIEMAKRFGGTDGHKFVNSLLDKLSQRLRLAETRSR